MIVKNKQREVYVTRIQRNIRKFIEIRSDPEFRG